MLRRIARLMAFFAFVFCVSPVFAQRETGFINRTVVVHGASRRYEVYVPFEWSKDRSWPVILFLNGHTTEGDDGLIQTGFGLGDAIRRHADRFPFVVVFPQSRLADDGYMEPDNEAVVMASLEQSMKEYRGDPTRVYLTGLSLGGYGTYGLAVRHPGKFAAFVVVCGGIQDRAGSRV